ncbi:AAA family ATPase, partial [Stenotrophomonas maltophilia]|uniref:AAA family ATPase n=1 Tax=Stenotrophomonas maltophilia TaxID=40324 RepID=UPI003D18ADFB
MFSAEPALVLNILRATKPTTRVILIGDPDQLPPIGQARALHDLAEIGALHHVHLEQAHRLGGSSSHLGSQTRRIAAGHEPVAGPG